MPASERERERGPTPIGWPGAFALAVTHALAFGLAFPPVDLWPLILIAPAPLAWLAVRARSTTPAVVATLVTLVPMWLWIDQWLIDVTPIGYPGKGVAHTLFAVAFIVIVRRLARHPRLSRVPLAVTVPVVWVGLETLRGEVIFDYPWFLLAHPLIAAPAAVQSADLLGTYFVSALAGAVAGAVADGLLATRDPARRRAAAITVATVLLLVVGNVIYGVARLRERLPDPARVVRLLLIQTNLPQDNKIGWTLEAQARDLGSFLALTRHAFNDAGGDVDLVVWPETMLPGRGLETETRRTLRAWGQDVEVAFAEAFLAMRKSLARPMLVGSVCYLGLDVDREQERWTWSRHYNSAYLVDNDGGLQRYDKIQLTPFGEAMPIISRWPWLEERLLALGAAGMAFNLDANPDARRLVLRLDDGEEVELATPICFEDTMARVCRPLVHEDGRKRASILVNLSNDGWFGDHDAVRAQHVQVARFRAIENRVPMIRSANTGYTVSIDSGGRIVGAVGDGPYGEARREGWLLAPVTLDGRRTLYGRVGDVWAWGSLVATVLLTAATMIGRRSGSG